MSAVVPTLRRLIFWQPIESMHQEAVLNWLGQHSGMEVFLCVEQAVPPERVGQGWRRPVWHRVECLDVSEPQHYNRMIAFRDSNTCHVFTGYFSHPIVWRAFRALADSGARLGIYSESPEIPGVAGRLRQVRDRVRSIRWAKRFDFILAVGDLGMRYFAKAGFSERSLIPFGYFHARPLQEPSEIQRVVDAPFRFLYAGQWIERKGVDILIKAFARLSGKQCCLRIFGDGPEGTKLKQLARKLGVASRVEFQPTLPTDELVAELTRADCVVLPSRWDGWGAIVNEALCAGTPIVCSSLCGASALLSKAECGTVFRAGSVSALCAALQSEALKGHADAKRRTVIKNTMQAASVPAVAEYMLASIRAVLDAKTLPTAPWRTVA